MHSQYSAYNLDVWTIDPPLGQHNIDVQYSAYIHDRGVQPIDHD